MGQPEDEVADALEVLVDAQLLQSPAPDRYRFHDLLRAYAADRANAEEPQASGTTPSAGCSPGTCTPSTPSRRWSPRYRYRFRCRTGNWRAASRSVPSLDRGTELV